MKAELDDLLKEYPDWIHSSELAPLINGSIGTGYWCLFQGKTIFAAVVSPVNKSTPAITWRERYTKANEWNMWTELMPLSKVDLETIQGEAVDACFMELVL